MIRVKFAIDEAQATFLDNFHQFGFNDRSALVRAALDHFQTELVHQRLIESAGLYAELYAEDRELQLLTASALSSWPEKSHAALDVSCKPALEEY